MKIRTQDARQIFEFGESYVKKWSNGSGVFVKGRYDRNAALAGIYEDEARAKGVLQEMLYAFEGRKPVFYMPAE